MSPSTNPTRDPTSAYYIHTNENTSLPLMKFNGEFYWEWKRCMLLAFSVNNKLSFLNGIINKYSIDNSNYKAWEICNNIIISYILRSLEPNIARSVINLTIIADIWKDLKERFSQNSSPQYIIFRSSCLDITRADFSEWLFQTN